MHSVCNITSKSAFPFRRWKYGRPSHRAFSSFASRLQAHREALRKTIRNQTKTEANIHQNGFSQIIQSHNLALSSENKNGYLQASTRFGTYQSGGASISPEGKMKISQVRGDDLIKDVDSFIAIKIDVEGFELSVLQGIKNLIKNNKIFLQIEIFDEELNETSKFLNDFNFKLIEKGSFTHQDTVKDYFYINF